MLQKYTQEQLMCSTTFSFLFLFFDKTQIIKRIEWYHIFKITFNDNLRV